ncbi:MAG TPA: TlpA disulfide reductase family protein [Opitutus sp.]|nr:TlpA disulfide reductase family protein [Opitutus sp.]
MKILRFALTSWVLTAMAILSQAEVVAPVAAPAWELKDVNGNVVRSDQFKGKVVVVDFWATWCGPCRMEIPGYVELQKKHGDKLAIIGMSVDQAGPGVVKKFMEKNKVDYTVVMADEDVVSKFGGSEGINAIPTTFIIDREGNIRDRKVGAEHTEDFGKRLAKYLE